MGAREKLFRKKIADQLDELIAESDIVYGSEAISKDKLSRIIDEAHQLLDRLTVYRFFHELPENDAFVLEFLELEEKMKKGEDAYEPDLSPDIPKIIDSFEEVIAEDAEVVPQEDFGEETGEAEVEEKEDGIPTVEDKENIPQPAKEASLEEKLKTQPIRSIMESIALNDRFLFTNELFGGSMEAFNKAIKELDHIATFDDAHRYVELQLKSTFNWDEDSETVENFVSLIKRRFSE